MYATDRRQTKASLNAPPIRAGIIIFYNLSISFISQPSRGDGSDGSDKRDKTIL